jgi:hypothetical protein
VMIDYLCLVFSFAFGQGFFEYAYTINPTTCVRIYIYIPF